MSERYAIRTGRTDIVPGDTVIHTDGYTYRALTYPHGAEIEVLGIRVPRGMVGKDAIYTPEIGELVAERYNPPLSVEALISAVDGTPMSGVKQSRFDVEAE